MAFDATKFARIGASFNNNVTALYAYATTADQKTTVAGADYFLSKKLELEVGDWILCTCSDGSEILVVATNTGTALTTTLFTA